MAKTLPKQAILIVNAGSRRGADLFAEAREKLAAAGIELLEARKCKSAKTMGTAVRRALKNAPMVIVGGGDGSLSSNVDDFVGTDVVFAVLPLGTANSFARTIGMPLDLDGAVEVIAEGEPRKIDVGCINGDYFLNAAAMGLAPKVAESVPHGLKRKLGRLGYLIWAGWSAANFRAFRVKLEDGKRTHRMWATEVRIANGRYHGGIELIENADLKSGEIVVQVVTGRSVAKLGWSYFASATKLKARRQTVREFVSSEFRLSTRPQMKVSIDGEIGAETPLEISAMPDAVTIAMPRGSYPKRSSAAR
ncbi:MAG: YegS/Rv2252/BmrU family lipid kinase [Sphingomonas sp.]|nr:YegS/Rv2252/BmrU family lipid kinase [Sphingomonas sp.]